MLKGSALILFKSFLQIFHNNSVNKIFKIVYIMLQLASFIPACTITWISSLTKASRNTFFFFLSILVLNEDMECVLSNVSMLKV